ncbi:MAG: FtsH protease activity modulator HflK [Planctomycetota bacterium]|jgi:membrane protease subunit HflK
MTDEFEQAILQFKYQLRRYRRLVTVAVVVIVGLILVSSVFYSIAPEEEGVVLRFGKHEDSTLPGLHTKLPWPIDRAIPVPIQKINTLEFGFATLAAGRVTQYRSPTREDLTVAEMLSADLNLAHVEWIVQYRIADAFKFLFKLGGERSQVKAVEDTIRDASETVMRRLVGDVSVDEVLTFGRDRIAGDAKQELQQVLNSFDCGVTVVAVKLQSVSPPEPVKDAFDSVNRARQNKERVINEAKGERNRLLPEARGKRDRTITEAEGYRELVVRTATGRANAFLARLAEYEKAPEVTRTRLYLEAMEELLQQVDEKLIIDEAVRGLVPLLDLNAAGTAPAAGKGGKS